jgi:serpin B
MTRSDDVLKEGAMQHPVPAKWAARPRLAILAVFVAVLTAGCGSATQRPDESPAPSTTNLLAGITVTPADVQAAANSDNALTVDLLQQVELANPDANFVDSAYSLATVLAMLQLGARGDTQAQIAAVLHSAGVTSRQQAAAWRELDRTLLNTATADGVSLDDANAVWLQSGLPVNAAFLDTLVKDFSAPSSQVDFQNNAQGAADLINQWVGAATKGMIPSVVTAQAIQGSELVLADATYFDAKWKSQFQAALTYQGTFLRPDNSQVSTAMMHREPSTLPIYTGDGVTAVELPYVGDHYVADVIMPTAQPLAGFVAGLTPQDLTSIEEHLAPTDSVALTLPKFDIATQLSLIPMLTALGMPDAFGSAADFSGIEDRGGLYVSLAQQSARIQVDEVGTTAAAATVFAIASSLPFASVNVVINHPFLLLIRDVTSGTILFTAQVTDPTAGPSGPSTSPSPSPTLSYSPATS